MVVVVAVLLVVMLFIFSVIIAAVITLHSAGFRKTRVFKKAQPNSFFGGFIGFWPLLGFSDFLFEQVVGKLVVWFISSAKLSFRFASTYLGYLNIHKFITCWSLEAVNVKKSLVITGVTNWNWIKFGAGSFFAFFTVFFTKKRLFFSGYYAGVWTLAQCHTVDIVIVTPCRHCRGVFARSASMRTMSAINSRASTPRSGTLRSHNDLQFGSGVNIGSYNMATGSRTLDRSFTGSFDRPTYERYGRSSSCERPGFDRSCPGSFDRHRNSDSDFFYNSPPLRSSLRTFQSRQDAEPDMAYSASAFTKKHSDMENNSRSKPFQFVLCRYILLFAGEKHQVRTQFSFQQAVGTRQS